MLLKRQISVVGVELLCALFDCVQISDGALKCEPRLRALSVSRYRIDTVPLCLPGGGK